MPFVVDASAALPWCFPDEATASTEALLDRVAVGEQVTVLAHWLTEVSNGLLMAMRRKRIERWQAERFLDQLAALRIMFEPPISVSQAQNVLALSIKHKLTFYDAAYLDLQPEVEAQMAAEAQARGLALDRFVEEMFRAQCGSEPGSQAESRTVADAVDRILRLCENTSLDGLQIKDLITEGRKY